MKLSNKILLILFICFTGISIIGCSVKSKDDNVGKLVKKTEKPEIKEPEYNMELILDNNNKYEIGYTDVTQNFEIPEIYNDLKGTKYKITAIADGTFYKNEELKSVIIADSVNKIGANAFNKCSSLEKVKLPVGLTEIGEWAFSDTSLEKIKLPAGLLKLEKSTFSSCNLQEINFQEGLTEIGEYAFHACTSLEKTKLPASLTKIGGYAFIYCTSLEEIKLPDSLTEIGEYAFSYCNSLKEIKLPENLKEIGEWAFYGCIGLKEIYCGFSKDYAEKQFGSNWINDTKIENNVKVIYNN